VKVPDCKSGKLTFPQAAWAEIQAQAASRRHDKRRYVYRCPMCGWWHMTSQPRGVAFRKVRV